MAIRLACGAERFFAAEAALITKVLSAGNVAVVQEGEYHEHYGTGQNNTQNVAHLHTPGGTTQDMTCLEVLQHLAGNCCRNTHDGSNAEYGCNARVALNTKCNEDEGGDNKRRERQSADRVIARTHDPDEVARHGGEEEGQDDHDGRCYDGNEQVGLKNKVGDPEGEQGHEANADHDPAKTDIFFIPGHIVLNAGSRLFHIFHRTSDTGGEAFPHFEKGITCAHKHATDGDWPDNELPDLVDLVCRVGDLLHGGIHRKGRIAAHQKSGPLLEVDARQEKIHDHRSHESPGQNTTAEVQRTQFRANDITYPHVSRADTGRTQQHAAFTFEYCACNDLIPEGDKFSHRY